MNDKLEVQSINLKENQLLAAQMIATGKTGKAIVEALNVTEETVSKWKQNVDFQVYLVGLLNDMHETAKIKMQNLIDKAVLAIEQSLDNENISAKDRFNIAVSIITMSNTYNFVANSNVAKLQGKTIY